MRLFRKKPPFTKRIIIEPPEPSPEREGVAIAVHLKNEENYVAEWAKFHRAVGIVHFVVYDNGCTDRTVAILREALPENALTVIPWKFRLHDVTNDQTLNSQVVAFAHAILNYGSRFRWMAFIDVDEFLLPKKGNTVEEALEGAKGFPNISLPWHMFGTNGHKKRPAGPVTRNFTMRASDPMSRLKNVSNFKCIVDPCAVSEVSVHHFLTKQYGDLTSNDAGLVVPRVERKLPKFYSSEFLQLNHYYTKSEEEFSNKIKRGPASPATMKRYSDRLNIAIENIHKSQIDDIYMIKFLDDRGIVL